MSDLGEYGERVTGWRNPFGLNRLDHRHHRNGAIHWRLTLGDRVIGYATTADDGAVAAVMQVSTAKEKRAEAWEQDPSAIVRRKSGTRSVQAMFLYPRDATEFVAAQKYPDHFIIENAEGRRIIGTTGHGHAILAALDQADEPALEGKDG